MKIIKLLLTSILLISILFSACSDKKKAPAVVQAGNDVKYTCPMHPNIMEDHTGNCPICGMSLVKKSGQASESPGISLDMVLQPVNASVISSVESVSPQEKEISTQITAQGYLDFDTRTFNNIAARFSGRIDKLYIKYAFQKINNGQRIFDIYSPDMVTAQQDLLHLKAQNAQETGLINAATQKLLLLGMTKAQVNQLNGTGKLFYSLPVYSPYSGHVHDMPHSQMAGDEIDKQIPSFYRNLPLVIKQGMYVEKGQNIFNVVDPHRLWAVIKIDRSAIASLKINQPVKITLPDQPESSINGKVNFIKPALQEGDKNTSIRMYINNMHDGRKVNSLVKASITTGVATRSGLPRSEYINLDRA